MSEPLIRSAGAVAGQAEAGITGDGAWLGGTADINSMFQEYRGSIPVVAGNYPLVRAEDPDHLKPVRRTVVHARVFKLQDEAELEKYISVMQECTDQEDGARLVAVQIKEPTDGVAEWTAFVQWVTAEILPPNQQGAEKHRPMNKRGARHG